jgi:hypothetical protein
MAMGNVNSNLLRKYKNKDIHRHCIDTLSSAEPYEFLVKWRNIKGGGGTNYARYDGKTEAT